MQAVCQTERRRAQWWVGAATGWRLFGLLTFLLLGAVAGSPLEDVKDLLAAGKWMEAEEVFRELETSRGLSPEETELAVQASTRLNHWNRVVELWENLRKRRELTTEQRLELYEAYLRAGDQAAGRRELIGLREEMPENERLVHLLVFTHLSDNQLEEGLRTYEEFLGAYPSAVESLVNASLICFKLEKTDRAFSFLGKAFANDPVKANEYFYAQLARNMAPEGLVGLAADTKRALGLPEDGVQAHLLLAREYERLNRYQLAIEHFEKYLSVQNSDDVRYSLAVLYHYVGEDQKSADMLAPILEQRGEIAERARLLGAELAVKLGDFDRVETLLKGLPPSYEQFALYHLLAGRLAVARSHLEKGVDSFQKAIELDPELTEAYFHLAQLLLRTGQVEKGREMMATYQRLQQTKEH